MPELPKDQEEFRAYRNRKLYRSLFRIMRVYNRHIIDELDIDVCRRAEHIESGPLRGSRHLGANANVASLSR